MAEVCASAPGKIMLAGEYAVLCGGPAVLCAVNRRAVARVGRASGALLQAVADTAPTPALAAIARETEVDSTALQDNRHKLGLGSSAATVVSAVARALKVGEGRAELDRVLAWSLHAHADAQSRAGHPGSGTDVIASAYGGMVEAYQNRDARRLRRPDGLRLSLVWTGQSAPTVPFLTAFESYRSRNESECETRMTAIADSARQVVSACDKNNAGAVVGAIFEARQALAGFARASGMALELPIHRELGDLAEQVRGAGKPTGAGGGDMFLAAFVSERDQIEFEEALRSRGHDPFEWSIDSGFSIG